MAAGNIFLLGVVIGLLLGFLVARALRHDTDDDLFGGC